MIRFIHAADLHLDSAFGAMSADRAAERRKELREIPGRLSDYVNEKGVGLVLLAGDLFDSSRAYRETAEALAAAFGRMRAKVLIAPGNHDAYGGLWEQVEWPENVYIFKENSMTSLTVGDFVFHGGAFTASRQTEGLLKGFHAKEDGKIHIGLLHGEVTSGESDYNPIHPEDIAASGLHYLALGHVHRRAEPVRYGKTLTAWPGCPEGRGFDETGEKGFYEGTISAEGEIRVEFIPFARRRHEIVTVDITGKDPLAAVEEAVGEDTKDHLYRLILTGETGEEGVDVQALEKTLGERFYALEIRDTTRMTEDLWARAEEDSLRGMFLRELRSRWNSAKTEEEKETVTAAARFGLAALDHRDLG